ncbi:MULTISPECIES: helix-turn-helix transcriptional regulator [unclassified Streptomyces]|uniref:helix-turn-helix domain-containing protein n=1 Tax=unclassified Streptomyces TaxID=2593676 RepID=UPI0003A0127D|nr:MULTISPECIES: helix-turn-helix transcriptional regulator [unclassified Streptomyces]MYT34259.1 helix-turn-helix domain-containing protein [Streptomyces sp. SID8354]
MVNRRELNPDESPNARFGERLRRLREERGWTQEELADRTGYSDTHVSAVETGRRSPTPRFAKSSDNAFGTGDQLERQSRAVRGSALLEGFPEFVDHEGGAVEIRLYEVGVIPGLLQTPEYASTLAKSAVKRGAITLDEADERVSLVAKRQAAIARPHPPMVLAVLDESCLRRPVGGPAVMGAQLARLIEFAELPHTVLQVAPFDMGEDRPFTLPITVLTLPDCSFMSYAESAQRAHLERESAAVLPILTAYHQMQANALPQAASVALIEQLRKGTP